MALSLPILKIYVAGVIALITILSGYASLHFIRRHQHLLQLGDAFADGIFLGAAAFHLLPSAYTGFRLHLQPIAALVIILLILIAGFSLLFFIEQVVTQREHTTTQSQRCGASAWMLTGILSTHAFIAGAALGISTTRVSVTILLIAILAHKAFESFALMMGLHRNANAGKTPSFILWMFAFVTPLGILLASWVDIHFQSAMGTSITSIFSTFAAGSFLYIGTLHDNGHEHFHPSRDRKHRHANLLMTSTGFILMGLVGIFI